MESLGKRLMRLRTNKNLSQAELARLIGVSSSTYREWELGRDIQGEPYMKLSEILEVSLTELLTGKIATFEEHLLRIEESVKSIRRSL